MTSQASPPDVSKAGQIWPIIITFPIVALITVLLRFITRFRIIRNPARDDLCIGLAIIFSGGMSVCMGFQVHNGMGRHGMYLQPWMISGSFKSLFSSIILYNFGLLFTKLSILIQYLRICATVWPRRACYLTVAFVIGNGIQTFWTAVFTCYPVAKFWDSTIPGGCVNESALWFANAGINIFSDFLVLVLPVAILKGLMMPKKQKITLMAILALGGLACISSVLRLQTLYVVSVSKDITWDNPGTATWSCMELNIGIICACISTLRPLVSKVFPSLFSSTRSHPRTGNLYASQSRVRGRIPTGGKFDNLGEPDEISLRPNIEGGNSIKGLPKDGGIWKGMEASVHVTRTGGSSHSFQSSTDGEVPAHIP